MPKKLMLVVFSVLVIGAAQARPHLRKLTVTNDLSHEMVWVTEGLVPMQHRVQPKSTMALKIRTGPIRSLKVEVEDDKAVMHRAKGCPTHSSHSLRLRVLARKHSPGQYYCEQY